MKDDMVEIVGSKGWILREHDEYCGDITCHSCYGPWLLHRCRNAEWSGEQDVVCPICGRYWFWVPAEESELVKALGIPGCWTSDGR